MREYTGSLKKEAEKLLAEGHVKTVIAFGPGADPLTPVPAFADDDGEAAGLLANGLCASGLARYVLDEVGGTLSPERRVAVLARGCESLGIARLIADKRVARENVVIRGIGCDGVIDKDKVLKRDARFGQAKTVKVIEIAAGEVYIEAELNGGATVSLRGEPENLLLDKCQKCIDRIPVMYDLMLDESEDGAGESVPWDRKRSLKARYSKVLEAEAQSPGEKYAFWGRQLERCIRCYACRNVCPACSCLKCAFDVADPEWLSKDTRLSEQFMFHFLRAFHVAGRCTGCGECERACPMGIPLSLLNDKLMKDVEEMYGIEDPFVPRESEPLGFYSPDDPEPWAREVKTS
jgi:formate dehydrogenase subunit beta